MSARASTATKKLASRAIFAQVIGMTKAFQYLPPQGWWRARSYHLSAPLLALAVVALFEQTHLSQRLEDQTVDLRFQARAPFDPKPDPRVVFVGIDDLSLDKLGKWVWPRYVEGDFLKAIAKANIKPPHTITFDILFTEKSNKLESDSADKNDVYLADAISLFPSVITAAYSVDDPNEEKVRDAMAKSTEDDLSQLGSTSPLKNVRGDINQIDGSNVADFPIPVIRSQSLFGFANADPSKIDDMRHTLPLVMRVQDKVFPSLALQTLCQMLNVDPDNVNVDLISRQITLKNSSGKTWSIPTTDKGEFYINYRRQNPPISFYGLMQNLNDNATSGVPMARDCDIENKTLIIGGVAEGVVDLGPTPLDAKSPLPYVHINVINNVLNHDYLSFVPWYWVVIGWSLVTWPTLLRLKVAPLVESIGVPSIIVVLYVAVAFGIFAFWSIQIALAWPVLSYAAVNFGGVVLRWREEAKGRQQIKGIFSQMVSPEVMNHLMKNPENMQLGGADRASTILFSDIRDYTGFSEGKTAAEVMRQLNIYFERMVACITECKGTVHKFIGDAVMAAWGDIADASLGPEQDARNAVNSAMLMRKRLHELNLERKEKGLTPIRIGIGLNHGVVQAGMLGSTGRKEFTMIGDEVNVASRLEGITKEFHTDVAISESVKQLIGDNFLVRRLGYIVLKGKSKPLMVFEVLAEKTKVAEAKMSPEGVAQYEEAFDHFLARRFVEAEAGFSACQKSYPDDYCTNQYLTAAREFIIEPPPPEWDGRIVMKTK